MVASQQQWLLEALPLRLRIAGVEYVESSVGVVNCHSLATLFFFFISRSDPTLSGSKLSVSAFILSFEFVSGINI